MSHADRAVVLLDRIAARAIAEPDCWDYDFRVIGGWVDELGLAFRPFEDDGFETATPIAVIMSDETAEGPSILAGPEAASWGSRQGGEAARIVEMFAAREANILKNASQAPRPYLFLVRTSAVAQDTTRQLAALSTQQRRVLDVWIDNLMREKVSLKLENEGLHETLSDFQNVFWRVEDTRSLGYEIRLGDGVVSLGREILTQALPLPTRGLSDIEIHFARRATAPFTLDIELIEVETGEVLRRWSRSRRKIRQGWHRLGFPVALMGARLSGALRLSLRHGEAPPLSMAEPTTVERAGVQLGDTRLSAPLALRLWQALPGSLSKLLDSDEDHGRWTPLPRDDFDRLGFAPNLGADIRRDFEMFAKAYPAFRIHPLTDQLLVVLAPLTLDAFVLAARVHAGVPDSRGQPVECAVAFLTDDPETISLAKIEAAPSFSGWHTIRGGEEISLSTRPESELGGSGHLCFTARLSDQAYGQDYSRTHWRDIELLCQDECGPMIVES